MDKRSPPTFKISVLAVSCGLSLLLVLALLRGFFSGFSGFFSSTKTNTSKFQFDLDVESLKHKPVAGETGRPFLTVRYDFE